MRSLILIASLMCCILVLISMMNKVHEREVKESFSEQNRFSKVLLELEEEAEEELNDDNTDDDDVETQAIISDGCECETTDMTVFKVDEIKPDKTNKVQFVDDVQMNIAEVSGTLTINETPFATFDAASNKLIIG